MPLIAGIDLESSGNDPATDRIVEVAVVAQELETGAERICYARRFNPECHIPAKVVAVHGITDADVMGAPLFKTAAPLLGNMLQKVNVLIAHNGIEFDAPMIMHEFLRAGVIVTPFPAVFDTMKDGRWATPDGKYPTLGELCWSLDVPYDPALAHGALYDVRVMLACYRRAVALGLWQLPELASNAA